MRQTASALLLSGATLLTASWAQGAPDLSGPLDVEGCVEVALSGHAHLARDAARVEQYRARLAEVQAIFTPKINALAFVAPTFTVRGGALQENVERDFSPDAWGPYTHLEAVLAMPIYTFGRGDAGNRAARHRLAVEKARLRETRNVVAREVRRLYAEHLYARSLEPMLEKALGQLQEALEQGRTRYEGGQGEISQIDLMKLEYGYAKLRRFSKVAEDGASLSFSALKHAMGLPEDASLNLADQRLKRPKGEAPQLSTLLQQAAKSRPEWAQLTEGRAAALSLAEAERLANAPTAFVAGTFNADYAPTRDDSPNPYHNDPFNRINGGVAIGLQWDFDPYTASAKGDAAEALAQEVDALKRFADTGIPLQVRQAHQSLTRALTLIEIARDEVKSTRKWMTSAATAYRTGLGPPRDLLEGLAAHLEARQSYYAALKAHRQALADLYFAVGRDHPLGSP
ncbi:MAG: TolC family protein [Bradymonadia bacterium]